MYRLEAFFAQQDTARLLGQGLPALAFPDDTVGRVLDRLYEVGTRKLLTACAVRADQVCGLDKRSVHFDTTSVSVYGEYLPPEDQQEYFCRAAADAAAAKRRSRSAAYHRLDVAVEERPRYGRGRPSSHKPRAVQAMR